MGELGVALEQPDLAAHFGELVVGGFDALPIVQPGAWVCPAEPFGPIIRLTFRGRPGRIFAAAAQGAGAEVGNCSPMYFSVRGHEQKPLAEGASVIAIVSQTLGVGLLPGCRPG